MFASVGSPLARRFEEELRGFINGRQEDHAAAREFLESARAPLLVSPFVLGYADVGLGLADASNVVLANRYDTLDVLTLDERRFRVRFRVLRRPCNRPFRSLPADAA